jgi:type VI protein secretion system component VasF
MSYGKLRTFLGGESVDHKQKKDLQKKAKRKRDNKDKKQSEKSRELEESKGTRVIRPFWFAVVGFILSMVALFSWFFFR